MSTHEYFARRRKVEALLRAIDFVFTDDFPTADEVETVWTPLTWRNLTEMASHLEKKKINAPSEASIALIVSELRGREQKAAS